MALYAVARFIGLDYSSTYDGTFPIVMAAGAFVYFLIWFLIKEDFRAAAAAIGLLAIAGYHVVAIAGLALFPLIFIAAITAIILGYLVYLVVKERAFILYLIALAINLLSVAAINTIFEIYLPK